MAGCRGCTTYIDNGVGTTRQGAGTRDNPFRIDVTGGGGGGGALPTGGTTGQVLAKQSGTDGDAIWVPARQVPNGGTTGQVLSKTSGTDQDLSWATILQVTSGGTTGHVLTKQASGYTWAAPTLPAGSVDIADMDTTAVDYLLDRTNHTGITPYSGIPAGVQLKVFSQVTTGYWPTSYAADGTPTYGTSQTTGTRPTSRTDLPVEWVQVVLGGGYPPDVASGTAGMLRGKDTEGVVS